jgi:hypothetical protein
LTTSTGANFAVYAPPESKQYTIKNASAYTATIYNSSALGNTTAAGSGVAIPAGKTMTVWSDGTDFSLQNNRFDGELASSVTGTTQTFGNSSTLLATTAFVQAALQALHPVGSIYINATNNTNPGTLLGFGTWAAFGAGRVPVGFNAADPLFDTAEETGGSKDSVVVSHTHTTGDAGSATGSFRIENRDNGVVPVTDATGIVTFSSGGSVGTSSLQGSGNITGTTRVTTTVPDHTHTVSTTGVSGTNANLQPYITVYMWKRTA